MTREWGFVHIPADGMGKVGRAEMLLGYPLAGGLASPPPPLRNIFRIDATGASDTFRATGSAGPGDIYRGSAGSGKMFRT